MISVIIPTENAELDLVHALAALVPAAAEGVVREVVVVDGGSTDNTAMVADAAGCTFVTRKGPRSERLAHGASVAKRGDWLLFLQPETLLESGWHHEAQAFMERAGRTPKGSKTAAAFRLRYEAFGFGPRLSEKAASVRSQLLGMPYGNQGLLISRQFYEKLGGHRPLPEMEDLDLAKRIGRNRMVFLRAAAVCAGEPGAAGYATGLRQALARFAVGALRVPASLAVKLHG